MASSHHHIKACPRCSGWAAAQRSHGHVLHATHRQLHLNPKQRPSQSPRRNGLPGNAAAKPLTARATRCGRRARTKSRAASPPEENFHWLWRVAHLACPTVPGFAFHYHTSGCDKAQPGEACDKGYHLCATKGCREKHSHAACPHEWHEEGAMESPPHWASSPRKLDARANLLTCWWSSADGCITRNPWRRWKPTCTCCGTGSAPFAIEFCSGTGGLTAQEGRDEGIIWSWQSGHGIEQSTNCESRPGNKCKYCHFGLPCRTTSRAREIPMSSKHHGPKPLRSDEFPDGIPNLTQKDKERLDLANKSMLQHAGWNFFVISLVCTGPWSNLRGASFGLLPFGQRFSRSSRRWWSHFIAAKKASLKQVVWSVCRHLRLSAPTSMCTYHGEWPLGVLPRPMKLNTH